jgi:hypothetical protein
MATISSRFWFRRPRLSIRNTPFIPTAIQKASGTNHVASGADWTKAASWRTASHAAANTLNYENAFPDSPALRPAPERLPENSPGSGTGPTEEGAFGHFL